MIKDLARLGLIGGIKAVEAVLDLHIVIHGRRASHPDLAIPEDASRRIRRCIVDETASRSDDLASPLGHVWEENPVNWGPIEDRGCHLAMP